MTDLVTRLRTYRGKAWEATECYNGLRDEAADEIETMRQQADDWKKIIVQKDKEIERLKALLTEAADELGTIADMAYPDRNDYPDEMLRYKRDMDLPNRIDEATRERRGRGGAGVKERELVAFYRIWEHINGCDNFELADRITQYRRDAVAEKDKEIERLKARCEVLERVIQNAENSCMTSACKMFGCQDREPDR